MLKATLWIADVATRSTKAFCRWQERMRFSKKEAAVRLDLSYAVVKYYFSGKRKHGEDHGVVEIPRIVLLACAAIEHNLSPID